MTYSVPVVYTYVFGADVEVEAESAEVAERMVVENKVSAEGLDWSRAFLVDTRLGNWKRTEQYDETKN